MHDQPRYEPLEASDFFADGRASRPAVPGTVARGSLEEDEVLRTGRVGDRFAEDFPVTVDRKLLDRGRERYDIFCSPCHDRLGTGRGMVVRRGFPEAASFHIERLRKAEPGWYFDVVTNGFGRMPGYAAQLRPRDRWAVVAYIRALQRSRSATPADVPPGRSLEPPPAAEGGVR
jgi:mono/diheme cytochrome c family protein